jgi:transposase
MISSITNRGRLAFMIFRQRFTARVFLNFLGRLLRLTRKTRKKVFLIVDGHAVHKSRSVSRWLAEHGEQIRIFYLPSYSPELNPDELLNQDVKTNALGRVPPRERPGNDGQRSLLPSDHTGKTHGGEELFLRTPRPIRRQLKSVINLVLGVISMAGQTSESLSSGMPIWLPFSI